MEQDRVSKVVIVAVTVVKSHHASPARRFLSQQNIIPHDVPERIPTATHDIHGIVHLCNKVTQSNFQWRWFHCCIRNYEVITKNRQIILLLIGTETGQS